MLPSPDAVRLRDGSDGSRVLPDKDTTFAFQRAAQARGHVSLHCEPRDLFIEDGDVFARVRDYA